MKLNQILAIEKGIKTRTYGEITELHKKSQKPDLFNGFDKKYRKLHEDGTDYPPEQKKVQYLAQDVLAQAIVLWTEGFDVSASKDWANRQAVAHVEIDGVMIIQDAPVTFLLYLEKQLLDIRKFVESLQVLDSSDEWKRDDTSGMFKTATVSTHRTAKVQRALVLHPPTEQHPAQTMLVTEDVLVGYWDTVKQTGAMPLSAKKMLLSKIEILSNAVKIAREKANGIDAKMIKVGEDIFKYLLGT